MNTKKKLTKRVRSKTAVVEQLEPRILFSADLLSASLEGEVKAELSASDTADWNSLVNDPTAIAGAQVKNNLVEQNERSTSLKSASGTPASAPSAYNPSAYNPPAYNPEESTVPTDLLSNEQSQTQHSAKPLLEPATRANDNTTEQSSKTAVALTPASNTVASDANEEDNADEISSTEFYKSERTELVFIDGSVEDSDQLLAELQNDDSPNTDWIIVDLDKSVNGINEITETLQGVNNIDAIHIISHGDGEGIQLGTEKLTAENFEQYSKEISAWSETFTNDGDLLIYGCDLASTDEGKSLLSDLAASCDCDVAASDDTTGHESLEADWNLEFRLGEVNTDVALPVSVQSAWLGTLLLVNDAPVLSSVEATDLSYQENDLATSLTSTIMIDDVDDTNIESATVSITGGFAGTEDELIFVDQLGITGSYNQSTGVLSLTGQSSVSNYQTAIQSIQYFNNSDDPSALTRTVEVIVNDGDDSSIAVSRNIAFTAVNDAPTLSNIETAAVQYTENGSPVGITTSPVSYTHLTLPTICSV